MTSVANAVSGAAQPLILKNDFGLKEAGMGMSMSITSAINAISGAFCVGALQHRMGNRSLIALCLFGMCAFHGIAIFLVPGSALLPTLMGSMKLLGLGAWSHPALFYISCTVLGSVFAFIMATVMTVMTTAAVPDEFKGTLMGFEHGIFSLARIGTPALGSYILVAYGASVCQYFHFVLVESLSYYLD